MKTFVRYSVVLVLSMLILFGSVSMLMPRAAGQTYGNNSTWARGGMEITYSISGATVTNSSSTGSQLEGGGSSTTLYLEGTFQAGATITVSGTFIADNTAYSDNAGSATIRAGSASNTTGSLAVPPSTSLAYAVSLVVPADAQSVDIAIGQGSAEASWGFGVTGSFSLPAVDHITIVSPYDSVLAGDVPFTITANVYAAGNTAVSDGTQVTFTLTDGQGGTLAGASISPNTASTSSGAASVTFTPPDASYWSDSLHSSFSGQNYIMITATVNGVQGSKTIDINQETKATETPAATATATAEPTSSVGTLLNTQVTLDADTPYKTYFYTLTTGQVITIDIGVTGDPVDFTIL